jgi:hypothetical protein
MVIPTTIRRLQNKQATEMSHMEKSHPKKLNEMEVNVSKLVSISKQVYTSGKVK